MRLRETVELAGYFWLPDDASKKAPGILKILDGGTISLEMVGSFSGPTGSLKELYSDVDLSRIVGQVEKLGFVTLERCIFTKRNYSFGGISKSHLTANWAILGVAFEKDEQVAFDDFVFSVEGLDEWLGITGITVEHDFDERACNVRYKKPNPIEVKLSSDVDLSIDFTSSTPSGANITSANVNQTSFLRLKTNSEMSPTFFFELSEKLRNFVSLACDAPVAIYDVEARNSTIKDGARPAKMKLYYGTVNHPDNEAVLQRHKLLFKYSDCIGNFADILQSWIKSYDTLKPVMNLYFASKAGAHKYLDGKFLSLAQAVETLHRRTSAETVMPFDVFEGVVENILNTCPETHREWLASRLTYANEISLSQRLKRLLEDCSDHFGSAKERKKLARFAVNTRNYLTHYDESLADKIARGRNMWILCMKLEALLQLHFLRQLCFSKQAISKVANDSHFLPKKLKLGFVEG
ncbi:hypothetical protein SAMCCGM7_pA0026 (plasmid) [Sinorhizobium americanum CCGM7]|uniref:ApeA N-terminal domain 1-containing protein n=1 Tax=Sinorhizobium americanum TaxID=194963 RepID=UPI0004D39991|nr:HEPN domain-containing protein [Sinorhizobium americanum]APG86365.1 hypothetical protein SAMCCGM7_pA0026 [Sinorhizobium americanum CCGM7]